MTALCIVDVQEKLFSHIDHHKKILKKMQILQKGCELLQLPLVVSEQYPKGLGKTILDVDGVHEEKTCFAAEHWQSLPHTHWILLGIETHVCVFQTAKKMLEAGKKPIVCVDAVGSRSPIDHNTALDEMRHMGVRVTTVETILFELLKDATHPQFKAIQALIK